MSEMLGTRSAQSTVNSSTIVVGTSRGTPQRKFTFDMVRAVAELFNKLTRTQMTQYVNVIVIVEREFKKTDINRISKVLPKTAVYHSQKGES